MTRAEVSDLIDLYVENCEVHGQEHGQAKAEALQTWHEAAQEGERGGPEVAVAVEAALAAVGSCGGLTVDASGCYAADAAAAVRAALADPAGALAKHDAEVLRAAADAFSTEALGFSDKGWGSNPLDQAAMGALVKALAWLRERADRIEAQP